MASTPPPPPQLRRVPEEPMLPRTVTATSGGGGGGTASGISPSILIIVVMVVVMLVASIAIHYFIRRMCRSSSSYSSPLPLAARNGSATPTPTSFMANLGDPPATDRGKAAADTVDAEKLIASLPLFTLSSSLARLPKSSPDCAVCQCPFAGDDELRLLPACCHAFHSRCVDQWLRSNPSCPLCRASISLPHPPLAAGDLRSVSMRVEVGSISSRRASSVANGDAVPPYTRTYPLPGRRDGEYLVEEELEVVLRSHKPEKLDCATATAANAQLILASATAPPASGDASRRVERALSSASTSFNSVRSSERWSTRWSNRWSGRFSNRWSGRYDGSASASATGEEYWWWEMDGGGDAAARRREVAEVGGFYAFLRWVTGAY